MTGDIDAGDGAITVRAARPNLVLRNDTSTIVGYVIVDSDAMMIMQYPPSGVGGPVLAPGEEISVPYSSIRSYNDASVAANVNWWRYLPGNDDLLEAYGALNTVCVPLD